MGCIVSLGSGLKSAIGVKKPTGYQKILPLALIKALEKIATDSQRVADSTAKLFLTRPKVYYRFDARNVGDLSLAEWELADDIVVHTRDYCEEPRVSEEIDQLVERLYASRGQGLQTEETALTLRDICEL